MTARLPHISPYRVQYPTAFSDLFPVVKRSELNLLDMAISRLPLILACIFSSVSFSLNPSNTGDRAVLKLSKILLIGISSKCIPRFLASPLAHLLLKSDV